MKILALTLSVLLTTSVMAGEKVNITVKGMVCSFCSQGITKKFKENPAVKDINVKLENHLVSIELKDDHKLDDQAINKILTDSGYAVEKIVR